MVGSHAFGENARALSFDGDLSDYITIAEAAALGVYGSQMTIRRRIRDGVISGYVSNNKMYVKRSELDEMVSFVRIDPENAGPYVKGVLERTAPYLDDDVRAEICQMMADVSDEAGDDDAR